MAKLEIDDFPRPATASTYTANDSILNAASNLNSSTSWPNVTTAATGNFTESFLNVTVEAPKNVTENFLNVTTEATRNLTESLLNTTTAATVAPTRPLTHTRWCQKDFIGCVPSNGVCLEMDLGGVATQKCECFCGYYGTRCDLLDVMKYLSVCLEASPRRESTPRPAGLHPVPVVTGVVVSLLLLMFIFWFIYWRMCRYRYRIRQLERELSLYRGDDVTAITTRLPPGTYWHNAAFQPEEEGLDPPHVVFGNNSTEQDINWHCHPGGFPLDAS